MNSIEALENIAITFDEGGYEPTTLGAKSGHFIKVFGDDFNTIKQELERLKKIEENYYSLNVSCEEIEFENVRLEEENKKLKQAIDILKDKMNLAVYHNKVYNTYSLDLLKFNDDFEDELSQEEYELLKEVLER